jgi:hypothetical protein
MNQVCRSGSISAVGEGTDSDSEDSESKMKAQAKAQVRMTASVIPGPITYYFQLRLAPLLPFVSHDHRTLHLLHAITGAALIHPKSSL